LKFTLEKKERRKSHITSVSRLIQETSSKLWIYKYAGWNKILDNTDIWPCAACEPSLSSWCPKEFSVVARHPPTNKRR
jgi:hypothetical protein